MHISLEEDLSVRMLMMMTFLNMILWSCYERGLIIKLIYLKEGLDILFWSLITFFICLEGRKRSDSLKRWVSTNLNWKSGPKLGVTMARRRGLDIRQMSLRIGWLFLVGVMVLASWMTCGFFILENMPEEEWITRVKLSTCSIIVPFRSKIVWLFLEAQLTQDRAQMLCFN